MGPYMYIMPVFVSTMRYTREQMFIHYFALIGVLASYIVFRKMVY
jgi:hypothetical protein